jgi:hypothetical protein
MTTKSACKPSSRVRIFRLNLWSLHILVVFKAHRIDCARLARSGQAATEPSPCDFDRKCMTLSTHFIQNICRLWSNRLDAARIGDQSE